MLLKFLNKLVEFEMLVDKTGFRVFRLNKILFVSFSDWTFKNNTTVETFKVYVKQPITFTVTNGTTSGEVTLSSNKITSFAEGTSMSGMGVTLIL